METYRRHSHCPRDIKRTESFHLNYSIDYSSIFIPLTVDNAIQYVLPSIAMDGDRFAHVNIPDEPFIATIRKDILKEKQIEKQMFLIVVK